MLPSRAEARRAGVAVRPAARRRCPAAVSAGRAAAPLAAQRVLRPPASLLRVTAVTAPRAPGPTAGQRATVPPRPPLTRRASPQ